MDSENSCNELGEQERKKRRGKGNSKNLQYVDRYTPTEHVDPENCCDELRKSKLTKEASDDESLTEDLFAPKKSKGKGKGKYKKKGNV